LPAAPAAHDAAVMHALTFSSTSPDETRRLGAAIGGVATPGDVLLLEGAFGVGKTALVQGLAAGLGVEGYVSSPSFIMINEHRGRLRLYHIDLYRLEDGLDPETLDALDEAFDAGGVSAVEWPDLLPPELRAGATVVTIEPVDETTRAIRVATPSVRLADALRAAGAEG
jgi:tRNA threonylcarbamoyladenosine biosynthesis protein TsaE